MKWTEIGGPVIKKLKAKNTGVVHLKYWRKKVLVKNSVSSRTVLQSWGQNKANRRTHQKIGKDEQEIFIKMVQIKPINFDASLFQESLFMIIMEIKKYEHKYKKSI